MSRRSECPVRDVGHAYARGDENDPFRRMPRFMARLVETFGGQLYNPKSKTRVDLERRVSTYCARVRAVHGDSCSVERQKLCCGCLHAAVRRAETSEHPYPVFRYALTHLLDDDQLYGQLHRTRETSYVPDHKVVFRALDLVD